MQNRAATMSDDDILQVVGSVLRDVTRRGNLVLRLHDRFAEDLKIDGDDMSFLFAPRLERAFGIRVRLADWSTVGTVADLVRLVRAYRTVDPPETT